MKMRNIKERLRPYFSGLVPLFVIAHFGHHITGAMLRPLTPMIRTDLGLSYTQVGWMMSAFAITNGISQLPAGWMADKFGTRLIILLSITGVAIAGFFIGFTNSFIMLLSLLILTGLLGGGYHPAAAMALSASIPDEYRGRGLGVHFVGGSSTFWIIPLVAAPIAARLGWRAPYLILAAPTIILGIMIYILAGRYLKAQQAKESAKNNGADTGAVETAIPWGRLIPFVVLTVLTGTLMQSSTAYLAVYAVDSLGVSEATAAMLMSVRPFIAAVAAPLGGYIADRFGPLKVMVTISFLAAPLIFSLGFAPNVITLTLIMVCIGLVSTARMPTSESYIFANSPENRRATLLGIYYFSGTGVSGVLTPLIGGFADRIGFRMAYVYTGVTMAAVALVCSVFIWRNREGKLDIPDIS
jgi:MFS family permease